MKVLGERSDMCPACMRGVVMAKYRSIDSPSVPMVRVFPMGCLEAINNGAFRNHQLKLRRDAAFGEKNFPWLNNVREVPFS